MRFLFTRAVAFGPFKNEELDFASGMTVVWGRNEAGKSSWHAAVFAGLCGLRRGSGRRKEDKEFAASHKPWDDDGWAVSTAVLMDDERKIEFVQNLADTGDCTAREMITGKDISADYINDGAPDGALLLGLNRETLPAVLCVRQTEILSVREKAGDLQEYLQRAAATGGRDATAEEAINRIKEFRAEEIGLQRSNSTKPLQRGINQLDSARAHLAEIRAEQAQLVALISERDARLSEANEVERRLGSASAAIMRRRVAELKTKVEKIQGFARQFSNGAPPDVHVEDDEVRAVEEALAAWANCPKEIHSLDGSTAEALQQEMEALPTSPPEGDVEPAASMETAYAERERVKTSADVHNAQRPEDRPQVADSSVDAAELRRLAEDLEKPAPEIDNDLEKQIEALQSAGGGLPLLSLAAGLVGGACGIGLVAAGWTLTGAAIAIAGLLLALVLSQRARAGGSNPDITRLQTRLAIQQEQQSQHTRAQAQAHDRAAELGLPVDVPGLRDLARRLDDAEVEGRRLDTWESRKVELESDLAVAEHRLREALTERRVTIAADEDLTSIVNRYRQECSENARLARDHERRQELGERLAARKQLEQRHEQDRALHENARRQVEAAAKTVGCEAEDPELAISGLEGYRRSVSKRAQVREAAWKQWSEYQALLDGSTPEDYDQQLGRAEEELERLPTEGLIDNGEAEEDLDTLEIDASETRKLADRLSGQVTERQKSARSVAEAEEALAAAELELQRVEELDRLTSKTLEFLDVARERVQRNIAPRLADSIAARLPQVTNGRYDEVRVDPDDLNIQVRAKGGLWREATRVSQGTSEQIYLLLRLALAEHLVTADETAPLLLDDVMVQSDRERSTALLELLHEVSQTRQVILFSQEGAVREWAEQNLASARDSLVQLTTEIAA
jgi:DNA repair protein SbcC/Rad50